MKNSFQTFLLIVLVCPVIGLIAGCGNSVIQSEAEASGEDNRPRIALVMKSLTNEFFTTMAAGAKQHHNQHSDEYELILNGIRDERNLARQVELVNEMIAAGVDAIVLTPADSKALAPVCKRAMDAGIVVVNIDNKLNAGVLEEIGIRVPFVGPDNRAGAKMVGDYLAARLEPGDQVAVLEGVPTAFNAQQRKLGFEDALNEAGVEIVDSQSGEWEMTYANRIASAMLSEHPDLKAIVCSNDSMALGALAAVRSANRGGEVMLVGFDNLTAIQQAIRNGDVLASADQHADQLAVYGIEYALDLLGGAPVQEDKETPVDLITIDSLR